MKKWKCPNCEVLTEYIIATVTGECSIDADGDSRLEQWETGFASCEHCGFEESEWGDDKFEIVDEE